MNNIFQLKRFGLLFREQTSKNLKIFLMGSVLVFAVLFALDLISLIGTKSQTLKFDFRIGYYSVFIFPAAILLSSSWFTFLSKKAPETGNLLLPVSAFERILVSFIINVIIFSIIYFGIVLSVELILFQDFTILHYLTHFSKYWSFYSALFFIQSLFLFGSLIFKKAAIIKTGFSLFIFYIFIQLIYTLLMNLVFKDIPNLKYGDVIFGGNYQIGNPAYINTIFNYLVYLGFPLIWIASYFKIKEKQV